MNLDSGLDLSREEMREMGYRTIDMLVEHFATLKDQRVGAKANPAEIFCKVSEPPPEQGMAYQALFDQLNRDIFPSTMHVNHPRFFAFVPGPGNYVSVMAEALAAGYNVFAGTWLGGSAAEAIETVTIDWLRQLCGFAEGCKGLFVSGGTMANVSALAVARHVILSDHLHGAVVYLSDQAHSSLEKALRVLGFLPHQIRYLKADDNYRLAPNDVTAAISEDRIAGKRPFCVIASAGTTNTGAIDPLPQLREICDQERMWLHVDGAYGAAAVLCNRGRTLLEGLTLADSLSLDPHKWLFQPFETGCILVRHGAHLRDTFRILPDYLQDVHRNSEEVNFTDLGIQLTRSFRALKLWLSFKVFGIAAFRAAIERGFRLAELAEARLREMSEWEVVSPAQMAVVCFGHRGFDDMAHACLVEAMLQDGFALVTSTVLRGRTVLRMCTINPRTTDSDVGLTLKKLDRLATLAR
ncbi:MAG: pyridoxal phosphate-dependent decarboxylase family protein [Bryobacteraceae bacterium]